jgi:thiamine biosynthesis protein ThiI
MPQTKEHDSATAAGEPPDANPRMALLRFGGEITLKAPATRRRFTKRLIKNLKDAVKSEGIEATIERDHDRVYVTAHDQGDLTLLSRCFGVQSISLVERKPWKSLDDLVAIATSLYTDRVRGRRFAVRVRRVGERREIGVHSQQVARAVGAALDKVAAKVDLDDPEVVVHLEIMPDWVYFFSERVRGPGGLPAGIEGRAVALVSGGFDSAVAAWLMLKRGVSLDYVFCNLGGREHQIGVLQVMKQISDQWSYGLRPHLHSLDFDLVTRNLRERSETRYWQILLKRLMLRAGSMIVAEREASAIVTGDAVGQVSSQTLQNIAVISQVTSIPILRPLVGFNKDEIIAIARKIGTEPLSREIDEYCAIVPNKPATHASLDAILREEARLDAALLERAVEQRSVIDLRALDIAAAEQSRLSTDSIEQGTVVIDLRSSAAYRGWHYPDALHLDFNRALRAYPQFDKHRDYVLYCEFGLKSAHLAELMCDAEFRARHFDSGLKKLIEYADKLGLSTPEV